MKSSLNVKDMSITVCAYIRRSSVNQAQNHSFEIQKNAIHIKASQLGLDLKEEAFFIDEATSAFRNKASERRGLEKIKRFILQHRIENLIIYDTSRVDRTIHTFVLEFYKPVKAEIPNFQVYVTTQDKAWNPDALEVKLSLLMSNAESEEKSRRSVDAQSMLLDRSKRPESTIPYGYHHEAMQLIIEQEEANIVVLIYYLAAWGYSMDQIVALLNESNVSTIRASCWHKSTIENILKNDSYLGTFQWNLQPIHKRYIHDSHHVPIISPSLYHFYKLTQHLKQKLKTFNTPFLLQGLLVCARCKEKMKAANQSTRKPSGKQYEYHYYKCIHCRYKLSTTKIHEVTLDNCERLFKQVVIANVDSLNEYIERMLALLHKRMIRGNKRLQNLLSNRQEILDSSTNQEIQLAFKKAIETMEQKLKRTEQLILHVQQLINDNLKGSMLGKFLQTSFANLYAHERKVLLHMLVEQVIYHHDSKSDGISMKVKLVPFLNLHK